MRRRACLTSVRFAMLCDIVKPVGQTTGDQGVWPPYQDADSGAIVQRFTETETGSEDHIIKDVPLFAEAVLDGGIRVAGTTERFSKVYDAADWVKAVFPASTDITRRDRVTNIRDRNGRVLWKEDEILGRPPTEFNVNGVAPVVLIGKIVELDVLLERAPVQ